jgi:hypothetical protein
MVHPPKDARTRGVGDGFEPRRASCIQGSWGEVMPSFSPVRSLGWAPGPGCMALDERMSERRRARRVLVTTLGSLFGERTVTAGIIRDLSPNGLRVMTEVEVKTGDLVEIKVDLPENRGALLARARVIWDGISGNRFHPHLVGMEFIQITAEDRARLEEFVRDTEDD